MKKHNFLIRILARAAKEAGLRTDVEPSTHGLLLGQFSKAECRRIFPKRVNKRYKDKFLEVLNAIDLVASPLCELDEQAKLKYVQARIEALPATPKEDTTGLRIDLAVENESTGESKWVDVTAVHTGAETYQEKELKAVTTRRVAALVANKVSLPDPLANEHSPLLIERTTAKIEKYSRLLLVAKKQTAERLRKQTPVFATFAVSDYGEMAPDAAEFLEWLVCQYRVKCEREGKRADGCKTLDLVPKKERHQAKY
jgi:hypothetical protein